MPSDFKETRNGKCYVKGKYIASNLYRLHTLKAVDVKINEIYTASF
jgi:hypothetical protein